LGKTIEAGLVLRELLLRRRIDFVLVAAPPSMTLQWQDELESKFGLSFQIIDRERLADLRRLRGFAVSRGPTDACWRDPSFPYCFILPLEAQTGCRPRCAKKGRIMSAG
jgi:hypothetical protein